MLAYGHPWARSNFRQPTDTFAVGTEAKGGKELADAGDVEE
jgi:hypothetical protein